MDEEAPAPTTAPGVDTNNAHSGEEEEPKPGTYLECRVCGTMFDLVQCKSKQPWYAVFIGRTVGVFRDL